MLIKILKELTKRQFNFIQVITAVIVFYYLTKGMLVAAAVTMALGVVLASAADLKVKKG